MRAKEEPDKAEKIQHERTHLPFAAWCKYCAETRARDTSHEQVEHEEKLPRIELDHSFVKTKSSEKVKPVLVVTYVQKQYGMAAVVKKKRTRCVSSVTHPEVLGGMWSEWQNQDCQR